MSFQSWLKNLRSAQTCTQRLSVEVLEDRLTPSFGWDGAYYPQPPPSTTFTPSPPFLADFTSDGILDRISPTRVASKAHQPSAEQPRHPGPSNNPRHHNHNPNSLESRCNLQPGRAVAHIPAEAEEPNLLRILPARMTSRKAMREMQRKLRNAIS